MVLKPFNFKLTIEKDSRGKHAAFGIIKTKAFRSRDIVVQHLDREQVKALAEYSEALGFNPYEGVVTADTYDVNSTPRLAIIVGKDKKKNISKIIFSGDEIDMGICK
jgi:hypothetical protein